MNKIKFVILFFVFGVITSCSENSPKTYQIKEIVKTKYFEVKVNSFSTSTTVNTGNMFSNLPRNSGVLYGIIDISFKNIDTESRMIIDGELILVGADNKEYTFDKSETILADGFGLFLDQVNPMITKRTKLIYKIPEDFIGKIYYKPSRNPENARIYLGDKVK